MKTLSALLTVMIMGFTPHAVANIFKVEKWLTSNGTQVVFYPALEVPMLNISMAFAAGSAYDESHYGLSALTIRMINQGNAGNDATTIAESLADTGAQFSIEIGRDMTTVNLKTLISEKELDQSTNILKQIINHPDFPDEVFEREKKQLLMAIEQAEDSPEELANLNFFKALYSNHPYAHPVDGAATTVAAIKKIQVIEFYRKYYVANNSVLVMVGAINLSQAHQLAEKLTKELPKGHPAPSISKAASLAQAKKIHHLFPSLQTVIRLGQIGIDHQNPYYFPLIVGNYILGGGTLISQLGQEVREKRGLTYGITSQFTPMPGRGPFMISLSTKNNSAAQAIKITADTLKLFIKNGPSKEELEAAKHYLTGSFPLSLSSNSAIASLLIRMTFYHLPEDYLNTYMTRINAVSLDEIKQAFQQEIKSDKLLLVTVGRT